jgi:hypothetical protein
MEEFWKQHVDRFGYQLVYPLTVIQIIWAIYSVRKYGPQWKTIDFARKTQVVLIVWGAIIFTFGCIAIYIRHGE